MRTRCDGAAWRGGAGSGAMAWGRQAISSLPSSPASMAPTLQACSRLATQACVRARSMWLGLPLASPPRRSSAAAAAAPSAEAAPGQQHAAQQHEQPPEQQGGQPSAFERLMKHARLTHVAQELWAQVVRPGDTVVDATAGNGHDTAALAAAVGPTGTVHAFDVQPAAVEATQRRVAESVQPEAAPRLECHLASHADMLQLVGGPGTARVVVFNLGFLPGSDKATITQTASTLAAVRAACEVLQPGGLCSILCYTGHPGGQEEYEAVRELVSQLPPSGWVSSEVRLLNRPTAPVLLLLWKQAR